MGKSKYVITITRQFGSLGRPIAKRLSEILGIEYYDRDLVDNAATQLNLPVSVVNDSEETAKDQTKGNKTFSRMMFPLGKGTTSTQDDIFRAQQNIIRFLAEKETCVIVGRCSDFTLRNMKNAVHVYIYASLDARLKHCIEDLGMEEDEARKMIMEVDKARFSYHMNYAGFYPNDEKHKDILIDSSFLGIEGTAQYLADAIKRKFDV